MVNAVKDGCLQHVAKMEKQGKETRKPFEPQPTGNENDIVVLHK